MRTIHWGIALAVLIGLCQSCKPGSSGGNEGQTDLNTDGPSTNQARKAYYQKKMMQKAYSFEEFRPCTYPDAPSHAMGGSVESMERFKQSTELKIEIYEDCCQQFLGEYHLKGDTLQIYYASISEELCECKCLYHYKMRLNEPIAESVFVILEKVQ